MPDLLYFIWAILPLTLFWVTAKAGAKTALKTGKREYPKALLNQLVFSVIAFLVAIFLDKRVVGLDTEFAQLVKDFGIDPRLVRWLIYPAIITIAAVVHQKFLDKAMKEAEAVKTARRRKYAPK